MATAVQVKLHKKQKIEREHPNILKTNKYL